MHADVRFSTWHFFPRTTPNTEIPKIRGVRRPSATKEEEEALVLMYH